MAEYEDDKFKGWNERINRDIEYRDDHVWSMDQMIAASHGPHYTRRVTATYMPWNHYHSYTSLMVGRLMYDNPRVRVQTRRPGTQKDTAEAIQHGLNRWVRDSKLRQFGQKMANDFCFSWGVAMVTRQPSKWGQISAERVFWGPDGKPVKGAKKAMWPACYRIPQNMFFVDSQALTFEEANYMGHSWYAEMEDIEKDAKNKDSGWKPEVIEALKTGGKASHGKAEEADPTRRQTASTQTSRTQVEFVTVWAANYQCDEKKGSNQGYNGSLLTFAKIPGEHSQSGVSWELAKEPESYYGPPRGPYVIFGAYYLPNRMWPLSPLVAVEAQIRAVNRQARAVERSNERHKRVILYNQRDTKTAALLKRAQHDFFVGIPGFEKQKFAEAELGGATEAQYKGTMWALETLQRVSAMDDAQQGKVTGQGTATEHSIAAESTTTRLAFLRQQFSDSMSTLLEIVSWYLYHDSSVVFPLGPEAAEQLAMEEPWFHGGSHDMGSDATYHDLELEIEAFSMQRMGQTEYGQAVEAGVNYLLSSLPMRAQFPYADWDKIDQLMAARFGVPDLDDLVDNEAALQMAPFMQPAPNNQPRLQRDVGSQYGKPLQPGQRSHVNGPQGMMEQAKNFQGGNNAVQPIGEAMGGPMQTGSV